MLLPAPSEEGEASAERSRIALPPVVRSVGGRRRCRLENIEEEREGKGEREREEMGALKHFGGRKIAPLCSSFFFLPPPLFVAAAALLSVFIAVPFSSSLPLSIFFAFSPLLPSLLYSRLNK